MSVRQEHSPWKTHYWFTSLLIKKLGTTALYNYRLNTDHIIHTDPSTSSVVSSQSVSEIVYFILFVMI